eukprot:TRINITY_DN28630_c0_g1_i1.p1 TRINITY_DN28630_c0_g1~~TRINITY_DN28630_c0_g1_i1.p1  ORF type:complete len:393 (-),score=93.80 TRINITY_DN28630_c0_g1_i1:167-1345(-)
MARLKLQCAWDSPRKYGGAPRAFLADLVRAAKHVDRVLDDMDLVTAYEMSGTPIVAKKAFGDDASRATSSRPGTKHGSPGSHLDDPGSGGRLTGGAKDFAAGRRPASAPEPLGSSSPGVGRSTPLRSARSISRAAAAKMGTSRPGTAVGVTGNIDRSCSPSVARIPRPKSGPKEGIPEAPAWFRPEGCPATVHDSPYLPEYPLWVSLHGGNGTWKKRAAETVFAQEVLDHEAFKKEWELREEREKARALEAEKRRRQEAIEEERRAQEAEKERQRRREEEERRRREAEEKQRQKLEEEERQRRKRLPRDCKACEGTGSCKTCDGRGFTQTLYLTSKVREGTSTACGRLPRGCERCGGSGDSADWGEFISGTGKCTGCHGQGKIQAPPRGWPD